MNTFKSKCYNAVLFSLFVFFASAFGQELELLQKFNPDLPASGRNASVMGKVIANLGDINGDNFDDWAFGFTDAADIATSKKVGKVYIYLGSSSPKNGQDPDIILQGEYDGDKFGGSVSAAGDINNDGYDDIIVGASMHDTGGDNSGRAYIYYGGNSLDSNVDVILNGESDGDYFGASVATAGDVNNDGYSDVIVGAWGSDASEDDAGRAYVYYGGDSMDNTADVIFTGEAADDYFGTDVASAGDVNNDGHDDVIISAYRNDAAGSDAGRVYVYYGSKSMDSEEDVILTGEDANDYFGNSISSAGDLNNDGYDDVIVGADRNDGSGSAYLFFGGSPMDSMIDVKLRAEASYDYFGESVASAGDVNNDGYDDVIVGAKHNDDAGTSAGRAYIYYGGLPTDNVAEVVLTGEASYDYFGCAVSPAGDINGDGYADVVVGAYGNDVGGSGSGRAYIYYGGVKMDNTRDVVFSGELAGDWFGCSVSSGGDVNNDGFDDIIVGAKWNDNGGGNAGQAYIYFGGTSIDSSADIILTGQEDNLQFGACVSSGDVNNDGFSDVIVGTDYAVAGEAYFYYGGSSMDNVADLIFTGGEDDWGFGKSVSSAGDVNNDGYEDMVIGSPWSKINGSERGKAFIYYGGLVFDNNVDLRLPGISIGSRFGFSVSSAGDVNDDGFADIIIGASGNNSVGVLAGRAYIYLGGSEMDSLPDIILSGEAEDDYFGASVSSAGDVNDDGFDDVIVGAYENGEGRVYVYFGGPSMDNVADLVLTGESEDDHFGISVSGAGDVNNDGFDDILIGAEWNNEGGRSAGRSYIYYGGMNIDTIPDIMMVGEAWGDYFGGSVAGAGDVNGDDISDIIIGAYGNYTVGAQMGRAYLYAGEDLSHINFEPLKQFPDQFFLYQNYPNPFNPSTKIQFTIPIAGNVELVLFNVLGERVKTLINHKYEAGHYEYILNASNLAAGIYYYQIKTAPFKQAKRMLLIK